LSGSSLLFPVVSGPRAESLEHDDGREPEAHGEHGGEEDTAARRHGYFIARAITMRWISFVPS
jgi:hypothetical protein